MFEIRLDGAVVYACTQELRFEHEARRYASVRNATFTFKGESL